MSSPGTTKWADRWPEIKSKEWHLCIPPGPPDVLCSEPPYSTNLRSMREWHPLECTSCGSVCDELMVSGLLVVAGRLCSDAFIR